MAKETSIEKKEGIIVESLPGLLFRVKLYNSEEEVLAHLGGKLKLNRIRVIPGDRVVIEMTAYDTKRGRIVRRL
ncbi:MAG: translation initiation factor IF-1 [Patescibacteria group bacterium]